MTVITAAAMTARSLLKILILRQATQFQRLYDLLGHSFLDLMQCLLCIEKSSRDGITQNCLALLFKRADFVAG